MAVGVGVGSCSKRLSAAVVDAGLEDGSDVVAAGVEAAAASIVAVGVEAAAVVVAGARGGCSWSWF